MENIIEAFEKLDTKIRNIEESITVLSHLPAVSDDVKNLEDFLKENKDLTAKMKKAHKEHHEHLMAEYKEVNATMSRCNLKMLYLLKCLEAKSEAAKDEPRTKTRVDSLKLVINPNNNRVTINEFIKSPLSKTRIRTKLQFSDFETEITDEDFDTISSYMKGRITLNELTEFLNNVIIQAFNEKYQILNQHSEVLTIVERSLQNTFKQQASFFTGLKFITAVDISRVLDKNLERKHDRYIQMLRHLNILREARKNSYVCYIWLKS
ncbi:CLUMA_CG008132, isoform A [Clunio marinus]|uniref:SKA complex subunit 1 n=1 Tax=Clunio marinus TaxID=568069 RepID=A0A1J1I2U4_9DIPT|nr:CLUMA_CG008132, isoform A [Clunio marinus]